MHLSFVNVRTLSLIYDNYNLESMDCVDENAPLPCTIYPRRWYDIKKHVQCVKCLR